MADRTLTINHADGGSETYTINRDKFAGVRDMTVDGQTVSVDHTAVPKEQSKETTLTTKERSKTEPEGVLLFGILGQSNAVGRALVVNAGNRFDALDALNGKARIYNRQSPVSLEDFDFGVNQYMRGGVAEDFGPESELLRLAASSTQEAVVVKHTAGGTALYDTWDSDAQGSRYHSFVTDYLNAVSLLEAEGKTVIHKGVLYAQGERDAKNDLGAGVASYYETKLRALVDNLRVDLALPSLPVVITTTTVEEPQFNTYTHVAEVNTAKYNVASNDSNTFIIDSSNYSFLDDHLHYDAAGQIQHGADFYDRVSGSYVEKTYDIKREIDPLLKDVVGGAAAAYSLRDLNDVLGNSNKVVRVRRSSDNAERDFTAAEMGAALEDWVNTEVSFSAGNTFFVQTGAGATVTNETSVSFDATATGGAFDVRAGGQNYIDAGASEVTVTLTVSNFSSSQDIELEAWSPEGVAVYVTVGTINGDGNYTFTFNVTEDGTGSIFRFRGSGLTSGDTISVSDLSLSWTKASGYVETWYDQSGNGNDATQTTAANQPKIVDAGTYLGEIDFDGVDDYLTFSSNVVVDGGDLYVTATINDDNLFSIAGAFISSSNKVFMPLAKSGDTNTEVYRGVTVGQLYVNGQAASIAQRGDAYNILSTSNKLLINFNDLTTLAHLSEIGRGGGTNTWAMEASIEEIVLYPSDQSSNRTAIEANINNHYSIY